MEIHIEIKTNYRLIFQLTIVYLPTAYWDVVAFLMHKLCTRVQERGRLSTLMNTIMTCSLSVNFRSAHDSPVLHISQHPPHNNVNYNK